MNQTPTTKVSRSLSTTDTEKTTSDIDKAYRDFWMEIRDKCQSPPKGTTSNDLLKYKKVLENTWFIYWRRKILLNRKI